MWSALLPGRLRTSPLICTCANEPDTCVCCQCAQCVDPETVHAFCAGTLGWPELGGMVPPGVALWLDNLYGQSSGEVGYQTEGHACIQPTDLAIAQAQGASLLYGEVLPAVRVRVRVCVRVCVQPPDASPPPFVSELTCPPPRRASAVRAGRGKDDGCAALAH